MWENWTDPIGRSSEYAPFRVVYRVEAGALRIVTVLRQEQDYDPARFLVD